MGTVPYMTIKELAESLGTNADKIREYARRVNDPLPVRYLAGKTRYGIVVVEEVTAWIDRNTVLYSEMVDAKRRAKG